MNTIGFDDGIDYHYIGMSMTAVVDYSTPDVQLDRTAKADGSRNAVGHTDHTDGYPGYDRFGRVVRHMWVDDEFQPFIAPGSGDGSLHGDSSKPHIPPIYELTHTYDQASNRRSRDNETATLAWTHREEAFDYDGLHRVTEAERSNGTSLHSSSRTWSLDMLGNWDSTATWDGTSYGDVENRTHNDANELESRTPPGAGSPLDMTFDNAGNMLTQEIGDGSTTVTYTYDAWNRLVQVKYNASIRSEYSYNGLNWRVLKRADTSHDGDLDQQRVMYYNTQWQLLEELINASWHDEADPEDHSRRMQYVWGARYIDDIVARQQRDPLGTLEPGALVKTWYHLTDTLFSTVAIIDDNATLIERVSYDAYGNARHHHRSDLNGDGHVNTSDYLMASGGAQWNNYGVGDLNRDGIVNTSDIIIIINDWAEALPAGQLSKTDNIIGYAGYIFNAEVHTSGGGGGLYTVRHRHYVPELGRWLTRDPIGYVDGMGLYEYVRSVPTHYVDMDGLCAGEVQWEPNVRGGRCRCKTNGRFVPSKLCKKGHRYRDPDRDKKKGRWRRVIRWVNPLQRIYSLNMCRLDYSECLDLAEDNYSECIEKARGIKCRDIRIEFQEICDKSYNIDVGICTAEYAACGALVVIDP